MDLISQPYLTLTCLAYSKQSLREFRRHARLCAANRTVVKDGVILIDEGPIKRLQSYYMRNERYIHFATHITLPDLIVLVDEEPNACLHRLRERKQWSRVHELSDADSISYLTRYRSATKEFALTWPVPSICIASADVEVIARHVSQQFAP
jgi:hypothetical protein